uniref:Phycobiliprotein ApcE n=1 Tax=Gracilaria vermiculophylla TaxID=2608709 RepID=A0A345U904_9FLOR|nr:phycobilisome linker polypeptide [Gracilaria vermiculophylla]AXI96940.1 phycobilisome linker polypeptide [Gracilaria vermiculophylla]QXU75145.1 phycobilisome linker polypeptide [Gracilaria vermiculophylla]WDZ67878.1 phycytochrome bilisome linker polypeptide [Gracilaria vermiculophylla]
MSVNATSGSPLVYPQLFRTASISAIVQAEQQDRFLQLGELDQLITFLKSGNKRLEVANILTKNANLLVSKASDKIFVGGSAISYLERPQASFLSSDQSGVKNLSGDVQNNFLAVVSAAFSTSDSLPAGFKPINIVRYGTSRMKKSLRDLDWFLRYLTYAIVAGDPNILSVNIRGLRELIDNACSSAAAIVALREMRKIALNIFNEDVQGQELVKEYFDVIITEFDRSALTDKLRRRDSTDLQGLRLPQIYNKASIVKQRFVMKTSLSSGEKDSVIKACYRQIFQRDIAKAYGINFRDLESQVKNGTLSIKEFVRCLGKSYIYRKQFLQPFVNSRVIELAFRHFLGRGVSSLEEFKKYFAILSSRGLEGLVDTILNSNEYADYFSEETVPYLRGLGEEAQEARNWGAQISLLNYSTAFRKIPQFVTLFADYKANLPDQHPYGLSNDPLLIQFGAIFVKNRVNLRKKSSFFGKDTRRILPRSGPGIYSQISSPNLRSKDLGSLGPKIFQLNLSNDTNINNPQLENNTEQVIRGSYLRVFGRLIYQSEQVTVKKIENLFRDKQISVREFITRLTKSSVFRSMYWDNLYICKAIEYIHNRLIGRPTYGRKEINKYFDIVYKQGYYKMIDAMVNSLEYIETFGDNIVPYERYTTSTELATRSLKSINQNQKYDISIASKFFKQSLSDFNLTKQGKIMQKINQGVSIKRDQKVIFSVDPSMDSGNMFQILRAIYRQIFERDLNSFIIGDEFFNLEKAFINRQITVRQLVEKLGSSALYAKEFYQPYPNTKVIEIGTKHFLGRAPKNQAEIRYYNQILASQGLACFISVLVNSREYDMIFGMNTVPYRRFPTLPAANFPNTEKLYNSLTKQDKSIVIPSFITFAGNQ